MPELPVISDMQNTRSATALNTPIRLHVPDRRTAFLNIDRFTLQQLKAR
jgi:hypothetical protein